MMETLQTASKANPRSRLVTMPSRTTGLPLRQLFPSKVMNLAELSRSIRAQHHLCRRVMEAARREPGWMDASVEEAIVLLGQRRLRELVVDATCNASLQDGSLPDHSSGQSRDRYEGQLL